MSESLVVVFAVYPGVNQLDFTAPYEVLSRAPGARCIVASRTGEAVTVDGGLRFEGIVRLADVAACDLLCVPGGHGTADAVGDQELLAQLRRLDAGARYLASVCTGSLLLGAAGLLKDVRATTHPSAYEDLRPFCREVMDQRIVDEGRIVTGRGVTSAIDLGLYLVEKLAGSQIRQRIQVQMDYPYGIE